MASFPTDPAPLEAVRATAHCLKVFPLPQAVLFPGMVMPLHIFEPRYRDLVSECLSGDQVMALAQLQPGWEPDYHRAPALREMVCAGTVLWSEKLPDDRFNILLQGTVRGRIVRELPSGKVFREVSVELLEDPPHHGPEEEALRKAAFELSARLPNELSERLLQIAARTQGGALADIVAATVVADVERRYRLLAERDVAVRLSEVLVDVGELIGRLGLAKPMGPVN